MGNVLQALNQGIDASNKITDTSRKAAAYNALKSAYGDIAGAPEQALELQSYDTRANEAPVDLAQKQLKLRSDTAAAPLQQRKLAAQAGQEEEITSDKADTRQAQAILRAAQFVQGGIDRGEDPLAKFDQISPLLKLSPEMTAAARASIEKNPAGVKDLIKAYAAKGASGPPDPSNVREYQFYSGLSPEQQANYLGVKRAANVGFGDVGGVRTATRVTPTGQITSTPLGTLAGETNAASKIAAAKQVGEATGKTEAQDLPMSATEVRRQQQSFEADTQSFDVADKAIDKALKDTGYGSAGLASHIPGNPWAANLAADLDTVQSKVVLDTISELKGLSKTGSTGFGQLSDREGDLIKARLGSVKQATTPAQLRESLIDLRHQLEISRERLRNAHTADLTARAPQPKSNKPESSDTSGGRVEGDNVILNWNPAKGMVE